MSDLPGWLLEESIEQANVGISVADARAEDMPLIYVNPAFEAITGYDRAYAVGRNCRFLQGEDTDPETVDRIRAAIEARETVSVVIRNYRRDGTPFWNQLELAPVHREGELTHYFGFQNDVTEREELRRDLARQNEQLETFASVVSHDLRNPLTVALAHLEEAREADTAEEEYLSTVEDALDRMGELVDDLLTLARQGGAIEGFDPVDLAAVARDAWGMVATDDATLDVAAGGTVAADRERLQTVFENLFSNAVAHGDADTVRVVETPDGFAVEDDGSGIPVEERDSVFDRGYTTDTGGTGYGLAIVATITEGHGWSVAVEESGTGGARFVFST